LWWNLPIWVRVLDQGARIFLNLFQDLTGAIFSTVGDMPVDSETHVVSSILRICQLSLSEMLIEVGVSVRVCM
jgi:hypothetical protein